MNDKLIISAFIGALSVMTVAAQTPDSRMETETPLTRSLAFTFEGSGSYLGVQTREVTKENFAKLGLREVRGVTVEKVVEGSPAAAAGLKDGDVIVRFNGEDITSGRKLSRLVSEVSPDHQVRLTVLRGGSEQEITATIGKTPAAKFDYGNFKFDLPQGADKVDLSKLRNLPEFRDTPPLQNFKMDEFPRMFNLPEGESFVWNSRTSRQIGVSVYPLTKQLGERYGVKGGVMINTVRENTAAAKAGLRAGDIIVEVDGKAVTNELDLIRWVNEKKEGAITLNVLRDGSRQTISVTPEPAKDGGFFFQTDDGKGVKPLMDKIQLLTRPTIPVPFVVNPFFPDWVI
jgi:serine protease Do